MNGLGDHPNMTASTAGGVDRRAFLALSVAGAAAFLSACGEPPGSRANPSSDLDLPNAGAWVMPSEEAPHEATWMCWPSSTDVWGRDLPDVQAAILRVVAAIARFEPVTVLARPNEAVTLRRHLGSEVEVIEGPVDDLWARDTLPCFLRSTSAGARQPLVAGRVRFNGWGNKQGHGGDSQLAAHVATTLGIPLVDSGLTGEGGGLEVDGRGTVLAARSSWVNRNRNPGVSESEIAARLVDLLGAKRLLWLDGIAGKDITDGHVDTLARFADPGTIVLDRPAYVEPGETWYDVSIATRTTVKGFLDLNDKPYQTVALTQPKSPRGRGDSFLSSYVNYYVCNGGVVAPQFGDARADAAAKSTLEDLYPDREVVLVDIDPIAAGGGGIHCATQQQPK